MEVYILFIEQVWGCSVIRQSTDIYASYEEAKKEFDLFVEDEMETVSKYDWIIEQNPDEFNAFEDGSYSENHTTVEIRKRELKTENEYMVGYNDALTDTEEQERHAFWCGMQEGYDRAIYKVVRLLTARGITSRIIKDIQAL